MTEQTSPIIGLFVCVYLLIGIGLRGLWANVGQVGKFLYVVAFPVHALLFEILRGLRWLACKARIYVTHVRLGLSVFVACCTYVVTDGDWKKTAIAFCITALPALLGPSKTVLNSGLADPSSKVALTALRIVRDCWEWSPPDEDAPAQRQGLGTWKAELHQHCS